MMGMMGRVLPIRLDLAQPNLRKFRDVVSSTKKSSVVHVPSNRLEETVHKVHEEFPLSQMNRCGSIPAEMHS